MLGYFGPNGLQRGLRFPAPNLGGPAGIQDQPGDIKRAVPGFGRNRVLPKPLRAPRAQLPQRSALPQAAARIQHPRLGGVRPGYLLRDQRQQITRVKAIAHLAPGAIKPDILQRPPPAIAVNPIRKDALVNPAKLARAGQHPAPENEHRQIEALGILASQEFRSAFGTAVERQRRLGGELLRDAPGPEPRNRRVGARHKPVALRVHRNGRERANRIDPAGAEQGKATTPLLLQLQHVDRAHKIMLEQLAAAGPAVHTGQHARIGGRLDNPVAAGQGFEVAGDADIAMKQPDAQPAQRPAVGLAAGAREVVQAEDLPVRPPFPQPAGERAAHKTANAGEENAHF
ncbi:MAG: hypothetical protein BWX68_02975 [Verrucomicrobia bacterium ADurb.Bin063]|nr:MAG: hypothetical protein BWX68_02975 [Verrucomicrobia bacterium ADurb.Bin063]